MSAIAFDIDGTLIRGGEPRQEVIALLQWFKAFGWKIIVWSSGGTEGGQSSYDHAEEWNTKLGLNAEVWEKGEWPVDIAVDDERKENVRKYHGVVANVYIYVGIGAKI